jgi:uncharacterized membrane protein
MSDVKQPAEASSPGVMELPEEKSRLATLAVQLVVIPVAVVLLCVALTALVVFAPVITDGENGEEVISGAVRLIGPAPNIPTIQPEADFDACGTKSRLTKSLILGTNQAVRDVIIYLGGYAQSNVTSETNGAVVLDQRNCEFVPRIQIARSGAPLILRNSDPVLHMVRIDAMSGTNGQRTLLKAVTPYAGYEKTYQLANFREPTLLQVVSANGHEWMNAYIAVLPHPWAALTDENGRFVLHNVPPGTQKIYAWHEVLGVLTKEVKLNGNHAAVVDFEFVTKK